MLLCVAIIGKLDLLIKKVGDRLERKGRRGAGFARDEGRKIGPELVASFARGKDPLLGERPSRPHRLTERDEGQTRFVRGILFPDDRGHLAAFPVLEGKDGQPGGRLGLPDVEGG